MKRILSLFIAFTLLLSCNAQTNNPSSYQTTNNTGMEKVYKFIKQCKTYYIATADGNQQRVRPFGTINMFEGKLYIQTGKMKNVSKQMQSYAVSMESNGLDYQASWFQTNE